MLVHALFGALPWHVRHIVHGRSLNVRKEIWMMQVVLKGKNVEITDWLREYVEKKVDKLDRYLPDIQEARVELSSQKTRSSQDRQVAQLTVRGNGLMLRAEERTDDMFAAIDAVVDKMHRQIARYKGKRIDRWQGQGPSRTEVEMPPLEADVLDELAEEETRRIVRVKRFAVSPMDEEEAIEQMELLGHDFFVFFNPNSGRMSVLYRRQDDNYGLLEPELM
jgi:putative sigma-54 modulation protein